MESRIQLLGHPVHQIAVGAPIGAFTFAAASDVAHLITGRDEFEAAGRLAIDFGLASALAAAPFGLVDWLAIPARTRAKRVGFWHAAGNVALIGMFLSVKVLRRSPSPACRVAAKVLSASGLGLLGVTSWLGGELVNRHGIGVHDVLGPNAPSSLTKPERNLQVN